MPDTAVDPNSWMSAGEAAAAAPPGPGGPSPMPAQNALAKAKAPNPALQPQSTAPATAPETSEKMTNDMPQVVMRPKRGGLIGVMDKIADALTGTTRPEIYTDQTGNEYVYHPNLSRGQQWARIGAGMFKGAAAGLAAGRGAGNMGKAALAGVEAGEQQAKEQHDREEELNNQAQKDMVNRANMTMLRMNMIEQGWRASRLQTEANEADAAASQKLIDFYTKDPKDGGAGGKVIGHAAHPGDLATVMGIDPQIAEHFIKDHIVEAVDTIDPKGHTGVTFIRMPNADWRNKPAGQGSTFGKFNPGTGLIEQHQGSDAMTMGEQADYDSKAYSDQLKYLNDKQELANKQQTHEKGAQEIKFAAQKEPLEEAHLRTQIGEGNARITKLKTGELNSDGTANPQFEQMAQALYEGRILPKDLKRTAKGQNFDPNAIMARANEIGQIPGNEPFSESIIEQEHSFANSAKTQAVLNGIERITDPNNGYMAQMLKLAQAADLGTNGRYNAASLAVRSWFGESTAKTFHTGVAELQRSIGGLIGNPQLGGGETDKKLEQARALIGEAPTLYNLQKAADILNQALMTQANPMLAHNRFLRQRYGAMLGQGGAAKTGNAPPRPPNVPPNAQWNQQANNGKGAWTL